MLFVPSFKCIALASSKEPFESQMQQPTPDILGFPREAPSKFSLQKDGLGGIHFTLLLFIFLGHDRNSP